MTALSIRTDPFFEGNRILIRSTTDDINPYPRFIPCLSLRDTRSPFHTQLFLTSHGEVPTERWPLAKLYQHLPKASGAQCLRARGATCKHRNRLDHYSSPGLLVLRHLEAIHLKAPLNSALSPLTNFAPFPPDHCVHLFPFLSFFPLLYISLLVAIHAAKLISRGQTGNGRLAPHALNSPSNSKPHRPLCKEWRRPEGVALPIKSCVRRSQSCAGSLKVALRGLKVCVDTTDLCNFEMPLELRDSVRNREKSCAKEISFAR